jgi:hypothetical protein
MNGRTRVLWQSVGERLLSACPDRFSRVLQGLEELAVILEAKRAIDWRLTFGRRSDPPDQV